MLYIRALLACDSLGCTNNEDVLYVMESGEVQFPSVEGMAWEEVAGKWVCPECAQKIKATPAAQTLHRKVVQGRQPQQTLPAQAHPSAQPYPTGPQVTAQPPMPSHAVVHRPAQGVPLTGQPVLPPQAPPPPLTIYAPQQNPANQALQVGPGVPNGNAPMSIPFNAPQGNAQAPQMAPVMVIPAPQTPMAQQGQPPMPQQEVINGVLQPVPLDKMPFQFETTPHPAFKK